MAMEARARVKKHYYTLLPTRMEKDKRRRKVQKQKINVELGLEAAKDRPCVRWCGVGGLEAVPAVVIQQLQLPWGGARDSTSTGRRRQEWATPLVEVASSSWRINRL